MLTTWMPHIWNSLGTRSPVRLFFLPLQLMLESFSQIVTADVKTLYLANSKIPHGIISIINDAWLIPILLLWLKAWWCPQWCRQRNNLLGLRNFKIQKDPSPLRMSLSEQQWKLLLVFGHKGWKTPGFLFVPFSPFFQVHAISCLFVPEHASQAAKPKFNIEFDVSIHPTLIELTFSALNTSQIYVLRIWNRGFINLKKAAHCKISGFEWQFSICLSHG